MSDRYAQSAQCLRAACLLSNMLIYQSRIPPEIEERITDSLHLPDVIAWRGTSRLAYTRVDAILSSLLRRIVGVYIEDPGCFLHDLDYYNGLIVGEAALAFLHCDILLLSDCLKIAVGKLHYKDVEAVLTARHWLTFETTPFPYDDRVPDVRVFRTPNKRYIKLVCSPNDSALGPVALHRLSALANYVSMRSFGSAFPLLTLRRLSLFSRRKVPPPQQGEVDGTEAADLVQEGELDGADSADLAQEGDLDGADSADLAQEGDLDGADGVIIEDPSVAYRASVAHEHLPDAETVLVRRLEGHGFRFRATPLELLDSAVPARECATTPYKCLKKWSICPDQTRYFGDNGSFVVFFNLFHNTPTFLAREHHAPYNPSVAWRFSRLWARCEQHCSSLDELLLYHWDLENLLILPRMVHYGPRFLGDWLLYSPAEMVCVYPFIRRTYTCLLTQYACAASA